MCLIIGLILNKLLGLFFENTRIKFQKSHVFYML